MRGAGCTWNDISDRKFDALVDRTKFRPLPSGQVSLKQASIWMVIQALIAFLVLLTFNTFAILVGVLALVPVLVYPFAKRFTWWPQVFLGITFNWGILLGYSAHKPEITLPCVVLYMAAILWTVFYDTIYAYQDIKDDIAIGIKSTARLFGDKASKFLSIFSIFIILLIIISHFLNSYDEEILRILPGTIGILAFGGHLYWQIKCLDISSPEICLTLFKSNTYAGLILLITLVISTIT